jgi:hypothetical protein
MILLSPADRLRYLLAQRAGCGGPELNSHPHALHLPNENAPTNKMPACGNSSTDTTPSLPLHHVLARPQRAPPTPASTLGSASASAAALHLQISDQATRPSISLKHWRHEVLGSQPVMALSLVPPRRVNHPWWTRYMLTCKGLKCCLIRGQQSSWLNAKHILADCLLHARKLEPIHSWCRLLCPGARQRVGATTCRDIGRA